MSRARRWHHGWTVNLSQSGVLFALPTPTDVDTDIEFVIKLSEGALNMPGVGFLPDLHCHGRVVRLVPGPAGVSLAAVDIRRQVVRARAKSREPRTPRKH